MKVDDVCLSGFKKEEEEEIVEMEEICCDDCNWKLDNGEHFNDWEIDAADFDFVGFVTKL